MADKPFVSPRRLKKFLTNLLGEKLNTKEEILANTDVKKFAGAMAVQEMYGELTDSLVKVKTYVGSDGKLHFVDASGADSVLPFSGGFTEAVGFYRYDNGNQYAFHIDLVNKIFSKTNGNGDINGNLISSTYNNLTGCYTFTALKDCETLKFLPIQSYFVEQKTLAGEIVNLNSEAIHISNGFGCVFAK